MSKLPAGTSVKNMIHCAQLVSSGGFHSNCTDISENLFSFFQLRKSDDAINVIIIYSLGGKFQYYDYGIFENIKKYKTASPPTYNINNIKIPMRFFYGKNDILADPTVSDIEEILKVQVLVHRNAFSPFWNVFHDCVVSLFLYHFILSLIYEGSVSHLLYTNSRSECDSINPSIVLSCAPITHHEKGFNFSQITP